MRRTKWILLFLSAVLTVSHTRWITAADWPEFRGERSIGHWLRPLPRSWSETENVTWKTAIPGSGWSSPVVRDAIYLTSAVDDERDGVSGHSLRAICVDPKSGELSWNVEVFWQPEGDLVEIHKKNSHASPTPILEGDRIYVHFGPHGTACVGTDGIVKWRTQELTYLPLHGNGGSPALEDDLLVINCDGRDIQYVAAVNKKNGEVVWRTSRDTDPSRGFSFCTPTIIEAGGRKQAICPASTAVFAYDLSTGRQLWRVDYGEGYSVVPRPLFAHGLVYVCTGFGDGQLLAIDPEGSGNVTSSHVRWSMGKGVPKSSTPIIVGDLLFMVDDAGIVTCLNAKTGEIAWKNRLKGKYSASPIVADGVLYFQNETGLTTLVAAGDEFQKIGENQVGADGERTFATLSPIEDDILLRNETHLYRIHDQVR